MKEPRGFENSFPKPETSNARDEIILKAIEMQAFKDIVVRASDKIEAIREVRAKLEEEFPETKDIPQAKPGSDADNRVGARLKNPLGATKPANDFFIAKAIVDKLRKEK